MIGGSGEFGERKGERHLPLSQTGTSLGSRVADSLTGQVGLADQRLS